MLLDIIDQSVVHLDDSTLPSENLGELYKTALLGGCDGVPVYDIEEIAACISLSLMIIGSECADEDEDDISLALRLAYTLAGEHPEFRYVQQFHGF